MNPQEAQEFLAFQELCKTNVFLFTKFAMKLKPAKPKKELVDKTFEVGGKIIKLFNKDGILVYPDLQFYTQDMFEHQTKKTFHLNNGEYLTWQQTVFLTAYNRAINTFGKDSFRNIDRFITVRSGHGIGKTSSMSIIALHFLLNFQGSQCAATANTQTQIEDIFLKELYIWKGKLPSIYKDSIEQTQGYVRMKGEKDWFLRATVAKADKPEALAGLHAPYVLILVDEASAVPNEVFEVMKGALTGENYVVIYISNPTRTEGEFYESHKQGSNFTKLHFSSRQSPIVSDGMIEKMEADYPSNGEILSDEVRVRVDGEFVGEAEMDEQGWIPLFANMQILFEPESHQVLNKPLIGVDPAGMGKDRSIINVRDNIYLKNVLNERTSNEKDLARKIEMIRDTYNSIDQDIAVDAFGIGATVVAEYNPASENGTLNALLLDKPREGTEHLYTSGKSELAWKFRKWVNEGGIIVTNRANVWLKELNDIRYKRNLQGKIQLMNKVEFKKRFGYSPDLFDASCNTFHRDTPSYTPKRTKKEKVDEEHEEFMSKIKKANNSYTQSTYSSMGD